MFKGTRERKLCCNFQMKSKVKLGQVMKKKTAKASAVELSGKKPNVAEKSSSKKKSNLPKVVPPIEDESDAEDDEVCNHSSVNLSVCLNN